MPQKAKHVPQRTCVICRTTAGKRGLIRVVTSEGVEIDLTGRSPGRGAYLCARSACWEGLLKRADRLERALRTRLTAEDRVKLAKQAQDLRDNEHGD